MLRLGGSRTLVLAALVSLAAGVTAARGYEGDARDRPGDFVVNRPASLYTRPSADSKIMRQIRPNTVVRVVEVTGQWYKVESTKGHENGYIRRSYADPVGARGGESRAGGGESRAGGGGGRASGGEAGQRFKVGIFKLTDPVVVRDQPSMDGRKIATLRQGAEVRVVDKDATKHWYRIESEAGNRPPGWIPVIAAKRVGDVR